MYGYVLGDPVGGIDPSGLIDANSGGGVGAGAMVGFGGVNIHEHINCNSNGCFLITTICGRLGIGIGFNFGAEGNAGFNPNGEYGSDCSNDKKECSYDWSIGVGGDLHAGGGIGGSIAGGSGGVSSILDMGPGIGIDAGIGVEACVVISCPI